MMKALLALTVCSAAIAQRLAVYPVNPFLFGQGSTQRLVVILTRADGSSADVTEETVYSSDKPAVATVQRGVITAVADGGASIRARTRGLEASTVALVQRANAPTEASFAADILPILTKLGCNGGACHGALNGQNGFKLSLFGYEPDADYEMIVNKHDGRRINRAQAGQSLLLGKPTFAVQHGGGKILREGSGEYNALLAWLRTGARRDAASERRMVALKVWPEKSLLTGKESKQRLLVTARFSDGTEGDVSQLVKFTSNDDSIASVSPSGFVTALRGGETAIVVRAPGLVAGAKVGVVLDNRPVPELEIYNFIDRHVSAKLKALHIPPSAVASDSEFVRRVYLDTAGIIPSAQDARRFLEDRSPNKRARLVDELLERPEYADYWAIYWGDHLSNTRQLLYNKGPYTFSRWLYNAFRKNMRYDEFARSLLVSSGNMFDSPATSYYPLMRKELDLAAMTSQLFLGVSIDCARCHNHPLEKWTQDDYNGMAAVFSQVRYKSAGPRNNERILYLDFNRNFQHPDTKKMYEPKALGGPMLKGDGELVDRREMLVDWLTAPSNPYFAKAIVNRMWRQFLGRGLVEPVDDFRATNPPTNEPLIEELARDFIEHHYDLHHLIRRITSSRTYQTSSVPVAGNKDDTMAYSHYTPKRLAAEQMLDSIGLATGVPDTYRSLAPGTRAMQIPDPEIESYFLEVFDRPSRQLICERRNAPTLNQALHLVSGDSLQKKIGDPASVLNQALERGYGAERVVEELYLGTLSRTPAAAERELAREAIRRAGDTRKGLEDVFWALLSAKEFLYNH